MASFPGRLPISDIGAKATVRALRRPTDARVPPSRPPPSLRKSCGPDRKSPPIRRGKASEIRKPAASDTASAREAPPTRRVRNGAPERSPRPTARLAARKELMANAVPARACLPQIACARSGDDVIRGPRGIWEERDQPRVAEPRSAGAARAVFQNSAESFSFTNSDCILH